MQLLEAEKHKPASDADLSSRSSLLRSPNESFSSNQSSYAVRAINAVRLSSDAVWAPFTGHLTAVLVADAPFVAPQKLPSRCS